MTDEDLYQLQSHHLRFALNLVFDNDVEVLLKKSTEPNVGKCVEVFLSKKSHKAVFNIQSRIGIDSDCGHGVIKTLIDLVNMDVNKWKEIKDN